MAKDAWCGCWDSLEQQPRHVKAALRIFKPQLALLHTLAMAALLPCMWGHGWSVMYHLTSLYFTLCY